ncbi:carbohydrate-binding module family 18 protein [Melanomma pulvis-pyrius CBS 109.77]|uniref:Carbohydrate-binding module family 18 protein n=1 Tax=Melanomma pulvis-pyrius CBS 109.77 TaxID=1314802 RepID=A0A6A6XD57_9PLEO|nr:carbohydrate-binding module family 18 protein [Melanomma pulvis-pyrius CBS 109.77]
MFSVPSALGALFGLLSLASAAPPFGLQIYSCTTPGVIAPGFDDGPWIYSEDILNRMEAANFKATWFINGQNKGNIYDYNATLNRMISMGHQIGSHTWSHQDLATLTADGVRSQMTMLEDALMNILGYFPYYMRPPFLSVNQQALSVLGDLEYNVVIGDLNTKDWDYQSQLGINTAKQLFVDGLNQGYTIVEAHDQEAWTHGELIDFMISTVQNRSIKTVTVGECMGQAPSEWYRSVRAPKASGTVFSSTSPVSSTSSASPTSLGPGSVTPDSTCGNVQKGAGKGYICKTGQCCSKYGNCGTTSDYCAASVCQSAFGKCDPAPGPGSVTPDSTCGNIQKGAGNGYVCKTGQCCSKYGNCGTTVDYCGAANGCQAAFGSCAS